MKRWILLGAILGLILAAQPAQAGFQLSVSVSGGTAVVIDDNTTGAISLSSLDTNGAAGQIVASVSVDGWSFILTTGVSKPSVGSTQAPELAMTVIAQSVGAGTVTVAITDTDFGPLSTSVDSAGLYTSIIQLQNTVSTSCFADADNAEFGMDPEDQVAALTNLTGVATGWQTWGTYPLDVTTSTAFSTSLSATIDHTAAGYTQLVARTSAVPEPATLVVWSLLAVVGFVGIRRRKAA